MIDKNETTYTLLNRMLETDTILYERILDTINFAYCFNQIVLRALEYEKIKAH
jgi:hypothetical protein